MDPLKFSFCLWLISATATQAHPAAKPSIVVSTEHLKIPAGGSGSVTCTPSGNPLPGIQWRKHEGKFGAGTKIIGNTLNIDDAQDSDGGYYLCLGVLDSSFVGQKYVYVEIENVDPSVNGDLTEEDREPLETQGNPTVTVSQRTLLIPTGGGGTIECRPEGNPLPTVQWTKSDGEFRSGISQRGNTLVISDAREEDRGHYVCQGVVDGTVMATAYSSVEIGSVTHTDASVEKSKVELSVSSLKIQTGQSGSVKCKPGGYPLPRVTWAKREGRLGARTSVVDNTLTIADAQEADKGYYVCIGYVGDTLVAQQFVYVDIEKGTQTVPTTKELKLTVSEEQLTIPEGGNGTIECTPEGNPLLRVQWVKSNGEFRDGVKQVGNTLVISDARQEDRGHYGCQGVVDGTVMLITYAAVDVDNSEALIEPPESQDIQLIVSKQQLVIPRGGSGSIECTPRGNPLPRVQWTKSNGEFRDGVEQSGNTLVLSDAREEDRGHYTCQGIVDGTVILTNYSSIDISGLSSTPSETLQEPQTQRLPENPTVTVREQQMEIPLGESVSIECIPGGNPLPTVQWAKSNGEFRNGIRQSGNTLVISDAREEDRGYYVCQGVVDGTVMATGYSSVYINTREPDQSERLPDTLDMVISEGRDFRISCDFNTGDEEQGVTWTRGDLRPLPQNAQVFGHELVFRSATQEDSGQYLCKVTASRGGFLLRVANIRVAVRTVPLVSVSVRPPAQTVSRGDVVTVECVVDGDAQVTWDRVDGSLTSRVESRDSTLYFNGIEVEDAGYYRCSAKNEAGISSGTAQVTVNDLEPSTENPENIQLIVSQQQLVLPRGGSGSIECTPRGNPLPRVQWTKSNGEFRHGVSPSGRTLVISDAREEDRGHYVCQGIVDGTVMLTNYSSVDITDLEPSTEYPENIELIVSQQQLVLPRGGSGSIECTPRGNPLPRVQWTKSNGEFRHGVSPSGNTLVISDAREEDRGHYVCQGIVDGTVMLTNYSSVDITDEPETPPENLRSPNVVVSHRQLTVHKGENLTIECTPEGDPLPTVRWVQSNGEFRDGISQSGNTLVIIDAREEDQHAYYVCQGIVDGTLMRDVSVAVYITDEEQPQTDLGNSRVRISERSVKIPRGGSATLECTGEGYPTPTIQWSKHDGEFGAGTRQNGNRLTISAAQEQDGGYYVCDGMVDGAAAWTDYSLVEIESIGSEPALAYPRATVNVRHLSIPRGGRVTVQCTPEGSPLPTIKWTKDNGNFGVGARQSGNSLVISDAQEEDGGNYVCSAILDGSSVFSDYLIIDIQYTCELPMETGPCRALHERWYYDTAQQKCQKFNWGGCGGNKNKFETEEQCSLECESMRPNAA